MRRIFLLKNDLAQLLRVSRRQIDRLMQRGLPHLKLGYRTVRFELEAVLRWLEEHCRVERIGPLGPRPHAR